MKKDRKLYPYIEDFGKAVYGEYTHLAFASFNEESFIKDATEKITILQTEASEMRRMLSMIRETLKSLWNDLSNYDINQQEKLNPGQINFAASPEIGKMIHKAAAILSEIDRLVGKRGKV